MSDGASISIKPQQITDLVTKLHLAEINVRSAGVAGIDEYTEEVWDRMIEMCPKDTGTLVASAFHEMEEQDGLIISRVGHGGNYARVHPETGKSSDSYAVEVHESMGVKRKNNATPKWVSKALNSVAGEYIHGMGIYISEALTEGGSYYNAVNRKHAYRMAVAKAWQEKRKARKLKLEASRRARGIGTTKSHNSSRHSSSLEDSLKRTQEQINILDEQDRREGWVTQRRRPRE